MTFVPKALRSPNGKGDKDRTGDREAYRRNFDRIFGRKEPECGGAVNCGLFTGKRTQPCGACRD